MQKYTLMHKDIPCAAVSFDSDSGRVTQYHAINPAYAPFLGSCDISKFRKWWEMRAVPASRELMKRVIRDAGVLTPESYLLKNLALSMTDTYWICPEDTDLIYDDVKLTNLIHHGRSKIPYHNATSYDPNASLGGSMDKYWDLSGDLPVLVKESYKYYGQQALNEVFAAKVHEMQKTDIPYVKYTASRTIDGGLVSKCTAFTSERMEFISAYDVLESGHVRGDINNYNAYINTTVNHGIEREVMQKFMDYQTLTDFVISNTDEHLLNFGVLRDPDTMQLIGPAPIFDSGNSMFFSEDRLTPYSRSELLERKVTGFYKTEEKMLKNVKDPSVVKSDLLPAPDMVRDFYAQSGIPEQKAEFISQNYRTKVEMLQELQRGISISLYKEKQKEKEMNKMRPVKNDPSVRVPQLFILLMGNSESDKQAEVKQLWHQMEEKGYHLIDDRALYPIRKAEENSPWISDTPKVISGIVPQQGDFSASAAIISPDSIRRERRQERFPDNDDMVFLTAMARIRQAVLNGTSVLYVADGPDASERETILHFISDRPGIRKQLIVLHPVLKKTDYEKEGWDDVIYKEPNL